MKHRWFLYLFMIVIVLASCGVQPASDSQDESPQDPQPVPPQEMVQEPTSTPDSILPEPTQQEAVDFSSAPVNKFVDLAKNDLVKTLSIDSAQIDLIETQEIIWPDAALGCPKPGVFYTQGTVPGYRIRLSVAGAEYIYHTDLNGRVLQCPSLDSVSTQDPNIGVPIQ